MKKFFSVMLLAITISSFSVVVNAQPRSSRPARGYYNSTVSKVLSGVYVTGKNIERVVDDIDRTHRVMSDRFPVKRDDKADLKIENGPGNNLTGRIWWTNAKIEARGTRAVLSYYDSNGITSQYVVTLDNKGVHEFDIITKNGPDRIMIVVVDRLMNLVYSDGKTEALLGNR